MNYYENNYGNNYGNIPMTLPPRNELWIISLLKGLAYMLLYIGIMNLIGIIDLIYLETVMLAQGKTLDDVIEAASNRSYAMMILSAVITIIILVVVQLVRKKPLAKAFHIKKVNPLVAFLSFVTGFFLNLVLNIIMTYVPQNIMDDYGESMSTMEEIPIVMAFLSAVIMAPIIEEIIFRGFAVSRFKRSMPKWVAIAISAVAFGAAHFSGHWIQVLYAGALGVMLGLVFCNTESIFPSMLMHLGFNLVSGIALIAENLNEEGMLIMNMVLGVLIIISVPASAIGIVFLVILTRPKKGANNQAQYMQGYPTGAYQYPNAYAYPNANGYPNTYGYPNANGYPNTYGYPNANGYPNVNTNANESQQTEVPSVAQAASDETSNPLENTHAGESAAEDKTTSQVNVSQENNTEDSSRNSNNTDSAGDHAKWW